MVNQFVLDQGVIDAPITLPEEIPGIGHDEGGSALDFSNYSMAKEESKGSLLPSPINVANEQQTQMEIEKPSTDNLISRMNNAQIQMQDLQKAIQNPDFKLDKLSTYLLKEKFKKAQNNLDYVSSKLDGNNDYGRKNRGRDLDAVTADYPKAAEKLVSWLVDGQSQLRQAMDSAKDMGKHSKNPELMISDAFAMQVKVYRAQVELEFATAIIQKSMEGIKTIMTVQL